jgi:hypothetical protein
MAEWQQLASFTTARFLGGEALACIVSLAAAGDAYIGCVVCCLQFLLLLLLVTVLFNASTTGIPELVMRLQELQKDVFLVSGGFRPIINPIAEMLGIPLDHVYANTILYQVLIIICQPALHPVRSLECYAHACVMQLRPPSADYNMLATGRWQLCRF